MLDSKSFNLPMGLKFLHFDFRLFKYAYSEFINCIFPDAGRHEKWQDQKNSLEDDE